MKRSLLVVMALLLVSATATAQSKAKKPSASKPQATHKVVNHDSADRIALGLSSEGRFGYLNPDHDPVVLDRERVCAFGNTKVVGQLEILALWGDGKHGEFDKKCTAPGLVPISQRLTQRFYQLLEAKDEQALSQVLDLLHNGHFIRRQYQPAREVEGKIVLPTPQPDLPELYGSRGVGTKTDFPPTPIGFTLHAILTDALHIAYGKYAGQAIRLAITTGFLMDSGDVVQSCINFTGEKAFVSAANPVSTGGAEVRAEALPRAQPQGITAVIRKIHLDRKGNELVLSEVKGWESERFEVHDGDSVRLNMNSEIEIPNVSEGETIRLTETRSAKGFKPEHKTAEFRVPTYHDGRFWLNDKPVSDISDGRIYLPEEFVNREKGRICGPLGGIYCWGPAVAATGLFFSLHHGSDSSKTPEQIYKTPVPPIPR